jgi:chromosome segregation ATPase
MPREQETFVCYALPATDAIPYEHVGHFIEGAAPEGARVIDATEAKRINDDVDSRTPPKSDIGAQLAASVDLKPLFDKIDALSKTVVSQAEALDAATAKIDAQAQDISQVKSDTKKQADDIDKAQKKIDDQASDISKVRENTAKAIAQMTEGIGEQKA